MLIFYQLLKLSLSASRSRNRCWYTSIFVEVVVVGTRPCRCFVVVGSGVPYCDCVRRLLRIIAGGVLLLLSASTLSKLTYTFVHTFQQVIGTNRKVFEIV